MKRQKLVSAGLIVFLLASLTLAALPNVEARTFHQTFYATGTLTTPHFDEGTFADPYEFGYLVNLYSQFNPTQEFLYYVYLLNSTDSGYRIAFYRNYAGNCEVQFAPVVNMIASTGVNIGVSTINGLVVMMHYNLSSSNFYLDVGGITVYNGEVGINQVISKYRIGGYFTAPDFLLLDMYGPDDAEGNYTNPVYNGINFVSSTNGELSTAGGSINWSTTADPFGGTDRSGGNGFYDGFPLSDSVLVQANANTGYNFLHFYVNEGTYTSNPSVFTYWGGNLTIYAVFYGTGEATPTPTPSPSPSVPPGTVDWGTFETDLLTIIELVIGAVLTVLGILILMKSTAWIIGLILIVVGFFFTILGLPNIYGLIGFSLECILSLVMFYGTGRKTEK